MRHQFVRLLGRGVKAHRMIDAVFDRKRHLRVGAIDRRRRRIKQMPATVVAAGFQHVEEAVEVCARIDVRMVDRVADARLRREMDHPCEPMPAKHVEQALAIGQVGLLERELVVVLQDGEPRLLQRRIIVGIHVVEPDDRTSLLQQLLRDMQADESGSSRDEHRVLRHRSASPE
jgi:hypothetical protein